MVDEEFSEQIEYELQMRWLNGSWHMVETSRERDSHDLVEKRWRREWDDREFRTIEVRIQRRVVP